MDKCIWCDSGEFVGLVLNVVGFGNGNGNG